jgi:AcrR family transcriptional regulator
VNTAADKPSLRDRILAGALQVIREKGVVAATTKEIARTAGVSEGSLYNHFANKTELIAATMAEVTSGIRGAMASLFGKVGRHTVEDNLTEFVVTAIAFWSDLLPIVGQVIGDRDLVSWLRREAPAGRNGGPLQGVAALAGYLEAERRAGRLAPDGQPPYLAAALVGACQQYAFLTLLAGPEAVAEQGMLSADPATYARHVVRTILTAQIT